MACDLAGDCCVRSDKDKDKSARGQNSTSPRPEKAHREEKHHQSGHHDGHHEGGWHEAEHQAEHRVTEKAGFGFAEHALERAVESTSERMLEHGATAGEHIIEQTAKMVAEGAVKRGVSTTSERMLERSAEAASERIFERGAEAVGERLAVRGASGATKLGEKAVADVANKTSHGSAHVAATHGHHLVDGGSRLNSSLRVIQAIVPIVGLGFVLHMAHQDWHRVHKELHKVGLAFSTVLFILAAMCDSYDCFVHLVVVTNLTITHVDHHLLHTLESWSLYAAACALCSMVAGELISGRQGESSKSKAE